MPYEELRSKILELTDNMTFKAVIDSLVEMGIFMRKNSDVSLVGYESQLSPRDQEILQLSRKYATAILEYFDNIGLTKRDKDVHILR